MQWNEIISEVVGLASDNEHNMLIKAGYELVSQDQNGNTYQSSDDSNNVIVVGNNGILTPNKIGRISAGKHSTVDQAIRFLAGEQTHKPSWQPFYGKAMTDQTNEAFASVTPDAMGKYVVLGYSVPAWGHGGDNDAATFNGGNRTVEVLHRDGQYEVWNGPKLIYKTSNLLSLEANLTKYKLTQFGGVHSFSQSDEQTVESVDLVEGAELHCPNCRDYMGKPSENDENVTCSNCGEKFFNRGGIRRHGMPDIKFGRLVLTGLENEEGCIQGTLKTSKGAILGSLAQYGPKWDHYDNGNWEAFCSAIKKRKKGFPDQKKAVEWIVRQTRAVAKQSVSEDGSMGRVFNGVNTSVPDWTAPDAEGEVLIFDDGKGGEAKVHKDATGFVMDVDNRWTHVEPDQASAEEWLKDNGYVNFVGVDSDWD